MAPEFLLDFVSDHTTRIPYEGAEHGGLWGVDCTSTPGDITGRTHSLGLR